MPPCCSAGTDTGSEPLTLLPRLVGSGKTHTMIGSCDDPGIVTRSLDRIFSLAGQSSSRLTCVFLSVLELYNNEFFDLLADSAGDSRKKLQKGGFTPQKVNRRDKIEVVRNGSQSSLKGKFTKLTVQSPEVAVAAINRALAARATSGTCLNDRSSRSHAIVSIQVQQADTSASASTVGSLYMVDLAGSERLKLSGVTGEAQTEAVHINTSLSALGNVLTALGKPTRERGLVPYRDSKLTLLLQDALGGNSKTLMIACVNGAAEQHQHAVVCLQYAARAKRIRNFASINVDTDKSSEIEALKLEVGLLKQRLLDRAREVEAARESSEHFELAEKAAECERLQALMQNHESERLALEARLHQVVNGRQMIEIQENDKFRELQHQLFLHNEKLLESYRDSQLHKYPPNWPVRGDYMTPYPVPCLTVGANRRELEAKEAELEGKRQAEAALLRQQEELLARNQELEERVRKLEMERLKETAEASAFQASKEAIAECRTPDGSPLIFHTPAPITPEVPQNWAVGDGRFHPVALQTHCDEDMERRASMTSGALGQAGALTRKLSGSVKKMAGGFRAFGAFNMARLSDAGASLARRRSSVESEQPGPPPARSSGVSFQKLRDEDEENRGSSKRSLDALYSSSLTSSDGPSAIVSVQPNLNHRPQSS
jgi:hypothetical protein